MAPQGKRVPSSRCSAISPVAIGGFRGRAHPRIGPVLRGFQGVPRVAWNIFQVSWCLPYRFRFSSKARRALARGLPGDRRTPLKRFISC